MYAVLPHNIETTDYCDVTSPYVYRVSQWEETMHIQADAAVIII